VALRTLGVAELVSVPLLAGGWLTGVLQVAAAPGAQIGDGQLQVLRILARQMAVAIENARIFAQSRADQERTRAVVDATNDAILMLDEHRRPMIVNRRARFFFGLTERDLLGKSCEHLGRAFDRIFEDGRRFNDWLGQLLRSQSERAVEEFSILSPEPRLLQCFAAPVMDVHDRYLGRILVFRDITREREVERMKNDFVSIVSHELRTPLTSIQGALQLVLGKPGGAPSGMGAGLPQRGRDLLSISLANTERLIRLINDILDIAKIEQGRIQLRREVLTAEDLSRSATAAMSAFANDRGIALEVQLPPWLPQVLADRDRSLQILINLISNGIKFSPAGQRVSVSASRDGSMICFSVRDWGRGIALEHQARIFQKFQQLDSSTTRDAGGTGLGLAISKALVEEQGGRMWLESEPGQGSTFSFTLPTAPGVESGEGGAGRPRALVAESDTALRGALCIALAEMGWEPLPASTAPALLALAGSGEAGMVLMGLPLNEADDELLPRLRAMPGTAEALLLLLSDTPPADLPRRSATLPRASTPAEVAAYAERLRVERRPLVLVVDDDPHVRPVLVRLLQRYGLRVVNASDGYSALATVERQRPDVMLLDIKMPGLDGFEVLRRLKGDPTTAGIPVIILTANDLSETTRAQGLALGARAYLEKPIAYERLISTINGVLRAGETS
jgi:PAS domain S-box-containing protein